MNTKTFKIKIGPIYVSKITDNLKGYYNFDFWLYIDGKMKEWGNLDGSFTTNQHAMRSILKRGGAHRIVLEKYL